MPRDVRERRKAEGKVSTYYTCCSERYPNTFTTSPPAEAAWIPLFALAHGYDGYLRWAYNSWTADPMNDTRFRRWTSGDCYCMYPEGRSSIRFEKLVEGIQNYEKALVLRQLLIESGDEQRLDEFERLLSRFTYETITSEGAEETLAAVRRQISTLPCL